MGDIEAKIIASTLKVNNTIKGISSWYYLLPITKDHNGIREEGVKDIGELLKYSNNIKLHFLF